MYSKLDKSYLNIIRVSRPKLIRQLLAIVPDSVIRIIAEIVKNLHANNIPIPVKANTKLQRYSGTLDQLNSNKNKRKFRKLLVACRPGFIPTIIKLASPFIFK